jgi:hypothetical protein
MSEYDLAQRERIRETLLSYMKEHKVGVPRLAARIKETVHRNPEIPVKTLQRFMKGEVRTIDMHVGFLAQFVEKVSKEDPTLRLGFALSAFYPSKDNGDLSGRFAASEISEWEPDSNDRYRSNIEIAIDQGVWRVKEVTTTAGSHQVYDGAMTSSGSTIFIVLKDRLLGLPRTITVRRVPSGDYNGVATAAYFAGRKDPIASQFSVYTRSVRIELRR